MFTLKRFDRSPLFFLFIASGLVLGVGCQSTQTTGVGREDEVVEATPPAPPPSLSARYDRELRDVLGLVREGKWDEAELMIRELKQLDAEDSSVERIFAWVTTESQRMRDRSLEAELRAIEARDPRFNPTLPSVLLDPRTRGVDLPQTLRQALDDVPKASNIPESYGQVIERAGPMVGFDRNASAMEELLKRPITLQVDDVTLESIIFSVGAGAGVNFVADRSLAQFKSKLSVNMTDVPLAEFLEYVSRQMGLHFEVGDNLVWVVDAKDAGKAFEQTRFYRLRRGFIMPAQFGASEVRETRVKDKDKETVTLQQTVEQFVRDGAPQEPTLEQAIQRFFTGLFMVDYERNVIVARGTRDQLRTLERIIEEFDRPVQQVLIEARFITVTEGAFLQLGTVWETGRPANVARAAVDYTGLGTGVGLGLEKTWFDVLNSSTLSAALTAIEQTGESQTLSSPRLTVLNNRPATIRDGKTQFYYEEYTVSQTILERRTSSTLVPKGRPTKLISGVSLDVLASIGGDGESIMMALNPKVSQDVELVTFATISDRDDTGRVVSTFDIRLPESRDQEISTRVVVRSGETVVMGGVIESEQSTFTEAVPVLGNIPIIGAAFRKRTERDRPRYLLIFVTATLLSESGEFIRYTNVAP